MAFPVGTRITGEFITPAIWNADFVANMNFLQPKPARTTADQSNSTTTFADATGVAFTIGASETYHVQLDCVMQVGGAEDGKTTWTVPSGATGRHWYAGGSAGNSSAAIGADLVIGVSGTADYIIQFGAIIVNSTTSGTCQWRFAQFAGGATPVILRANAVLIPTRVA